MTKWNIQFCIIGISETWLRDDSHSVDIDGYRFIHKNRPNRTSGGVGLYISENLEFKLRPDLCFDNPDIAKSLFIEIKKPKGKNIIVGIVYRAPNLHPDDFLSKNTEVLDKISRENKICYLLGDFNLNLINFQTHNPTGEFLDDMYSHMFFPLITRPSRITSHTATLIHNIFSNLLDGHLVNGLLFTDISDHLPVFAINFTSTVSKVLSVHKVTIRDNSEEKIVEF